MTRGLVRLFAAATIAAAIMATSVPLQAQASADARLRQQRDDLERIRREREALERRAKELQSTARDLSEEVTVLGRQRAATERILSTLDAQLALITEEVDSASARVGRAETELADKRTMLRQRLVDVYKRGPMHSTAALLSSRSFGELVARYKYLHLLTIRDRALVDRVSALRDRVAMDRDRLLQLQLQVDENRKEKAREEARLESLRRASSQNLAEVRQEAKRVQDRIVQRRRDEARIAGVIAAIDAERRRVAASGRGAAAAAAARSTLTTASFGQLDWPVQGDLLYTFGKAQSTNNTTIRWNGVGIAAGAGTVVKSVAAGTVASVLPRFGTYGLTVIVDHGGGDYSIYGSLGRADVREKQAVTRGQTVGTVGLSDPDMPAHLHFEIRKSVGGGGPAAVDPAEWLKGRR